MYIESENEYSTTRKLILFIIFLNYGIRYILLILLMLVGERKKNNLKSTKMSKPQFKATKHSAYEITCFQSLNNSFYKSRNLHFIQKKFICIIKIKDNIVIKWKKKSFNLISS